jgi:hypothetical protein
MLTWQRAATHACSTKQMLVELNMLNEARIEVAPASASSRAPRLRRVPALRRIAEGDQGASRYVAMARGDEVGKIGFHMSTLHDHLVTLP